MNPSVDPAQDADDVRPEKVVNDGPVECYRKGYEDAQDALIAEAIADGHITPPVQDAETWNRHHNPQAYIASLEDLLYRAWTVIANAQWDEQTEEWRQAARAWRDVWHAHLDGLGIAHHDGSIPTEGAE